MTVKAIKKNDWQIPKSSAYWQRSLVLDSGHLLGPGSEKKWYSMEENIPQGILDCIAEEMLLEFGESGCPIFPCNNSIVQVKSQKQRTRKTVDTFCCGSGYNWDCFSHNCFCQSAQSLRSSCKHV